ncbi:HAD-IIIA family hydrolase [Roseomonas sp. BN140053]|uniref:HAD-IIIA family hydrolase n=1 Tax=Roseomonas sp. BN140053 TaxID=3391898 RepID=UPI0039E83A13
MPAPATIRQAAILIGGMGTRLGALAADTPKPLLPCGDRPFLAWLMRELSRFGVRDFVLLAGHLPARVAELLPGLVATLPIEAQVSVSLEPFPAGTGGAVLHARQHLDEQFLLCNGDSFLDGNLARLLSGAAAAPPEAVAQVALRAVPDTSRYGVVREAGGRITEFRPRPPQDSPAAPGLINAGLYVVRRDPLMERLEPVCSLEADVLPRLAAEGRLGGSVLDGYFIDIGVPEDLARARAELPGRLRRPALFLDRDGVLNHDHGWVGTRERFRWTDGALEALRLATEAGWHAMVVTNQSGVARGFYDEAAVRGLLDWMASEVRARGGTLDDARYCPHHPEAPLAAYRRVCGCRKPAAGMLRDLIARWELEPSRCLMIGDQPNDMLAAAAAGVAGHLLQPGVRVDELVRSLLAIETNSPREPRALQ